MHRFTAKTVTGSRMRVATSTVCHRSVQRCVSTTGALWAATGAAPPPPPPPPQRPVPMAPPPPPPTASASPPTVEATPAPPPPLPAPSALHVTGSPQTPSRPPGARERSPSQHGRPSPPRQGKKPKSAVKPNTPTPKSKSATKSRDAARSGRSSKTPARTLPHAPPPLPPHRTGGAASPPPPPRPPSAPLAPPPPAAAAAAATSSLNDIYTIAPPKPAVTDSAVASADEVASVLQPSFAAAVEAAVLHARDTIPTRRAKVEAVPSDNAAAEEEEGLTQDAPGESPADAPDDTHTALSTKAATHTITEADIVSESLREASAPSEADGQEVWRSDPDLAPLPSAFASSVDNHEIPSHMGGDEADVETIGDDNGSIANTTQTAHHPDLTATTATLGATEEVNPFVVWRGVREPLPSPGPGTMPYIRVTTAAPVLTSARFVATVQVVERPPTMAALLESLLGALGEVEAWAATQTSCTVGGTSKTEGGASHADRQIIVRLSSSPHLPFFTAEQHALELSATELAAYCKQRDHVLRRLYYPSVPGLTFAAEAQGTVSDLAAELFFACSTRRLMTLTAETSVGFPSLSLGLFPSFYTVNRLRQLQGVLFTIDNVPKLHEYDASSLGDVGLAEIPAQSRAPTEEGMLSGVMVAQPPAPGWGAWLEDQALSRLCRSPSSREAVITHLLLPRGFTCQCQGLEGVFSAMPAWREYALRAATHCQEEGGDRTAIATACRCQAMVTGLRSGDTRAVGEATGVLPFRSAPRCHSRRLLRHAAATQRRQLAPLTSPLFVTFRPHEVDQWPKKENALAEAMADSTSDDPAGRGGATAVLDVSGHALPDTLRLLASFKEKGFHRSQSLRVVLLGDADTAAQTVLREVPCAAIISAVSPFTVMPFASSLQQVRLFAHSEWPADLQHDTLAAAATYLQHLSTPYVLCATPALQRVVVAYLTEALRMMTTKTATAPVSAAQLERAAVTELGLFCGPVELLKLYGGPAGMKAMITSIRTCATAGAASVPLASRSQLMLDEATASESALQAMLVRPDPSDAESFTTAFSRRGGESTSSQKNGAELRRHANATPVQPSGVSDAEVAQRLLAVVVNCLCALLQEGAVLSVNDANLLSVAALGFSENTGGALALADDMGLDTVVDEMKQLATQYGRTLAPHPLLTEMVNGGNTFASTAAENDTV